MKSQHDNPKRWRPRFTIRTLIVVVTLVCAYAACWGPTKRWGRIDVKPDSDYYYMWHARAVAPLVVMTKEGYGDTSDPTVWHEYRRFYFWFFGYVAKLPYERERAIEFDFSFTQESFGRPYSPVTFQDR